MQIRVLFFAQLRDITNKKEIIIEAPENCTITDLKPVIAKLYPDVRPFFETISFAVDNEYVSSEKILEPECCVALIPPISGG